MSSLLMSFVCVGVCVCTDLIQRHMSGVVRMVSQESFIKDASFLEELSFFKGSMDKQLRRKGDQLKIHSIECTKEQSQTKTKGNKYYRDISGKNERSLPFFFFPFPHTTIKQCIFVQIYHSSKKQIIFSHLLFIIHFVLKQHTFLECLFFSFFFFF